MRRSSKRCEATAAPLLAARTALYVGNHAFTHAHGAADHARAAQCYYVGATDDAASSILKDVVTPLSGGVPRELVCERLKKRDPVVCELQYESAGACPPPCALSAVPSPGPYTRSVALPQMPRWTGRRRT
jgi:hypothetical protein